MGVCLVEMVEINQSELGEQGVLPVLKEKIELRIFSTLPCWALIHS